MILETLQQRQWYFAQIVCLAALNSSMLIILCPYPSGSNNSEWEWNSEISLQILTYRQQLAKLWYSVLEVAVPWCTTQFCCFLILRAQVRNQLNTSEHFSINLQRQAVKSKPLWTLSCWFISSLFEQQSERASVVGQPVTASQPVKLRLCIPTLTANKPIKPATDFAGRFLKHFVVSDKWAVPNG